MSEHSHISEKSNVLESLFKFLTGRSYFLFYAIPLFGFVFLMNLYVSTRYEHFIPQLVNFSFSFLFALILTVCITPIIISLARKMGIEDKHGDVKRHLPPTALLGGLAIYSAFIIILFFYFPWSPKTASIVAGGTIILILGTLDDIYRLSSKIRLLGQLLASWLVISSGLTVSFLPNNYWCKGLEMLITFIWILGIVNATNFLDGADGLAVGFTFICSIFFFLITMHLKELDVCLLVSVLGGCCLGFLIFNFKPAKIYLGDGGSTFLGFMLATVSLYGGWSSKGAFYALSIPILILSVLIFDMIYITLSRIKNGQVKNFNQWLDYRGQDHFHHRLINLGFKEEHAVIFIYLISTVLGLSAMVVENAKMSYPVVLLFSQAVLIFLVITVLMLVGRNVKN